MARSNDDFRARMEATHRQAVTIERSGPALVRDFLYRYRSSMQALLPPETTLERFLALVVASCRERPELVECLSTQKGVGSLVKSCLDIARLGLEPSGPLGECWVLPFRDHGTMTANLIVGYEGYVALAYRSGQLSSIKPGIVCEGDEFEVSEGTGTHDFLRHKRAMSGRGAPQAWWIRVKMTDGGDVFHWLSREEVETRHRAFSRLRESEMWTKHYDSGALKSVWKEMQKWLPRAIRQQTMPATVVDDTGLSSVSDIEAEFGHLPTGDEPAGDDASTTHGAGEGEAV